MIHGFDVSAFQGTSVPTADFIFVKATEGSSYTNAKFAAQWASAKTHARVRGAYHYGRPEASSAASQADRLLARANAVPGEMLCLDLEESGLSQSLTNAWAREFGDRLRARAPGVTTVLYMGSGYASNNTGRDLSKHFDLWWYPQYPSSKSTSSWPKSFSPWLPDTVTTGWTRPHIWQFTSSFAGAYDANISSLTIDQLAGGGQTEDDDMAQVTSIGADGQVVKAGQMLQVKFADEFTDKHGLHGDAGVSVVIASAEYWCLPSAIFELRGLTEGDRVDVSWTRVKDDGTWIDDHWRLPFYANKDGVIRSEIGGQLGVDASNRLRLRIYNMSDNDANLQSCMAKATLVKY